LHPVHAGTRNVKNDRVLTRPRISIEDRLIERPGPIRIRVCNDVCISARNAQPGGKQKRDGGSEEGSAARFHGNNLCYAFLRLLASAHHFRAWASIAVRYSPTPRACD